LKIQALKTLYYDVLQDYITILSYEKDLKNLDIEIDNYNKRIAELKDRINIGRSRDTEVLTVQATVAGIQAEISQIKGALRVTRKIFYYLTNIDENCQLTDYSINSDLNSLAYYLEKTPKRPEIDAAKLTLDSAEENIPINRGAQYPTIDLNGNYYIKREGLLSNVPWDANITLTMPIYDGGIIRSKTRAAVSQRDQADLAMQQALINAHQEIATDFDTVVWDKAQVIDLMNSKVISKKNVESIVIEYRNGLVTNVDVLTAMALLDEARRSLDKMIYTTAWDYTKLLTAAELNEHLNPPKS